MNEELKSKYGIYAIDNKNCNDINRVDVALKIYVELLRSASDKGVLFDKNIDKNIALISFKFADTFIEGSESL